MLDELLPDGKLKLKINKVYVKEPLCPSYKHIIGKCNSLFKKKCITSFYTVKVKVEINYVNNDANVTSVANQEADLAEIIGKETIDEISVY